MNRKSRTSYKYFLYFLQVEVLLLVRCAFPFIKSIKRLKYYYRAVAQKPGILGIWCLGVQMFGHTRYHWRDIRFIYFS